MEYIALITINPFWNKVKYREGFYRRRKAEQGERGEGRKEERRQEKKERKKGRKKEGGKEGGGKEGGRRKERDRERKNIGDGMRI